MTGIWMSRVSACWNSTSKLIELRKKHPNLHRRKFFQDRTIRGSVVRDVAWFGTDGNELSDEVWGEAWNRSLAVMFNGKTMNCMDEEGNSVEDDSFLIIVNAADQGVEYTLPEPPNKTPWRQVLDTENLDSPFGKTETSASAIVGGRAVRVYTDGVEEVPKKRLARTI